MDGNFAHLCTEYETFDSDKVADIEKFLENKIHECEKGAVGRICPLILDTQYWGYFCIRYKKDPQVSPKET